MSGEQSFVACYHGWALITGASSGIGRAPSSPSNHGDSAGALHMSRHSDGLKLGASAPFGPWLLVACTLSAVRIV